MGSQVSLPKPSSTIQAVGVAGALTTAAWAIYNWLQLGPPADEVVVSSTTTAISTVVGYFKRENVYPTR